MAWDDATGDFVCRVVHGIHVRKEESFTHTLRLSGGDFVVRRLRHLASPLAVDLYLASFPAIQRDLATTPGMVQLTLTSYLIGISIGQPVWGPLSERFGRRFRFRGLCVVQPRQGITGLIFGQGQIVCATCNDRRALLDDEVTRAMGRRSKGME